MILLGILAAIAIPAYNGIVDRARASVVEAAAANALKEAIVADSMGSDSSKFQEILDNNSNDDVTVTYHDSSGQRSNVPGKPIVVESWWNDGSTEKFNVVVPAPTTPGGGEVTPPEDVDSLFRMTLRCDNDGTFSTNLYPLDEVIITNKSDNSQSVYNDYAPNDYSDQEFDLLGGIEYTFTASAVGDNFDSMYVARWPGADCIRSIDSWGSQASDSLATALEYAPNLEYVAPIPLNVTNINAMFQNSPFNGDLSEWDTSNVENMSQLFAWSGFNNSSISNWDTSSVTDMSSMFSGYASRFNQDISEWDVSNVKDMSDMFAYNEYFNFPIGEWDVSNVEDMSGMFQDASAFNQDISTWDVSNVTNYYRFADGSPLQFLPNFN